MKRFDIGVATALETKGLRAQVHCPICTRTVEAQVVPLERYGKVRVAYGQKCPRCAAVLDAAYILSVPGSLN